MKTKALALVAAVFAAGTITSMAQVYSANAVGYVNISLPAGLSLIANPLDNGDNNLNTTLPNLPDTAAGTTIFRFDPAIQNYADAIQWFPGVGWFAPSGLPDDPLLIIPPGEGFFVQAFVPFDVTFVGDVMQGDLSNPVPAGNNLSIKASQVPQEAPLGHIADTTGPASGLEFPASSGDTVFTWNPTLQTYSDAILYFDGVGWLEPAPLEGPTIKVGEGFFVLKVDAAATVDWARSFSVN